MRKMRSHQLEERRRRLKQQQRAKTQRIKFELEYAKRRDAFLALMQLATKAKKAPEDE